ncbi:hypothetical protein [Pulveribacter sp.]|uniref:hypothetical protein n=1 Tax=Pulveribacter sp. TaxID=2678893 RepID=UPI0028AD132D|nr:hypothetical protein [Pulveribacter sp.]
MELQLSDEQARAIYCQAIDLLADDGNGEHWWREVCKEMRQVDAAPDAPAAARIIEWWHDDWARAGDCALSAALRVRQAAAATYTTGIQNNSKG